MSEQNNAIPTFTPPTDTAPTFTPPSGNQRYHNGPCCYYHRDEPAVATCARCGKHLCDDCYDAYGVSSGEYANQALCYDCTQKLVAENVEELTKNKKKIKFHFIVSIVGIVIGFLYGLLMGLASGDFGAAVLSAVIGAGIGGVFLSAMKAFASLTWEAIKIAFSGNFGVITIISLIFHVIVIVFKCIWVTITNTIDYIKYLKETDGFIESDRAALEQMREYMEYTRVRNQNKGVDLETLMAQGSELYNNSFAQMVRDRGEEAATEEISRAATRIAANGEIIRDFAA